MAGAAGGFVTRAFESMLKECSGKKHPSLQKAIQAYLDQEKAGHAIDVSSESTTAVIVKGSAVEGGPDYPHTDEKNSFTVSSTIRATEKVSGSRLGGSYKDGYALDVTEAELVLNPLQIAFSTKNLKVVELALDCLHKLLAYDHLEGDPGIDGGQNSSLFTVILDMVCNCINDSSPDSTVLQVLKVLLTAVSSTKFKVHGDPLLAVISVCYNVTLNSKSPVNQATSKAMLIQIMSTVFRRMEVDENVNVATYPPDRDVVHDVTPAPEFSQHVLSSEDEDDVLTMPLERSETLEEGTHPSPTEEDANISVPSFEELQNLAATTDIKVLEAVLDKAVHTKLGTKNAKGMDLRSMMVEHRDALLVFRTLCKMGMKQDGDEVTTKTRILSLELLHGLLEAVDLSLTKNIYFIDSIKAYLTYVLLRASVAFSPIIFQYATAIFSVLLRFRESLKAEVGIFFPVIILRTLDGSESALSHRISVLRMLEKVCKDPQMLVDIFVNYDCDLEAPNLFERMVTTLSRITQGTLILDTNTAAAPQMASVRGSSLQCLVNVLKSLVDWKKLQNESIVIKRSRDASLSVADRDFPDVKEDGDGPADFKKAKAHKCTLEAAISEFNRDPVKGVEYLIANGLVENSPASVASFLKSTSSLDKAMIGDYLGHHEEFPLAVMNAYVDGMEFSGLNFSRAIRLFLQMFRLPGEAQKIDRIMEKFSERYYADNPDLFKSANVAYILSYSVIMLNTDAHNPLVWPKMSKSDFFHLNSVSNTAESAPKELLEDVYDSIVSEEIKMKHDNAFLISEGKKRLDGEGLGYLMNILKLNLPRRKSQNEAQHESEAIIHKTQAILRNRAAKKEFYTSHQVELVRPIIESVGWPLLATFSVIMEEGDHKSKVPLCMEGFRAGIYITYSLGMDTMRYAFLTSLVRFTFLHAPKQMRSKNVEALRTLLSFCESEPATLQDTWNAVLECVSRLEYIISTPSISASVMDTSNQLSRDAIVHNLKELAGKPLEQVYLNSTKLTSDSVVEFFSALCGVSSEELKQNPPRVFSLQKLVEVSYYNMARIRLVWAQIWSVLSDHFIFSGSHRDEKVAMYAIDSLRQLGMKYLERAELANFSFQNDILRPFIVLIRSSPSETLRSLIVDSVVQMIKSRVGDIKSGWKSVFTIFTSAADDECESIVEGAFENVEQVILEHFDQVVGDCFMDCVNCIIRFANSKCSDQISLKSIALLRICEDRLADGLIPGGALKPLRTAAAAVDLTERYWFPMLAGLSELTSDSRVEVRRCALEVLFDLLNERGSKFSRSFWESVFHRVLFPIFYDGAVSVSDEETVVHSLQLLCDLFSAFYREVSFMLPPLLALLLDCAKKPDQSVVSISLGALVRLIDVGGHQFAAHDWETLLDGLRDALYMTQPLELLNATFHDRSHRPPDSPAASQPSPSRNAAAAAGEAQDRDGPSIGQRFLGNVMDNAFVRSLTSSRSRLPPPPDVPSEDADALPDRDVEEEDDGGTAPVLPETVLSKSIAQLLLLGAVDCVQKKFWLNLEGRQKIAVMDILLSALDFAASYNSLANLRTRMRHVPTDRPPMNLLRQELTGTCIYLDVLRRATDGDAGNAESAATAAAEERLVSFCTHVLVEVSPSAPERRSPAGTGGRSNLEIHQVLQLRSPVVVAVLRGMCFMNRLIFKKHLREFYPSITKLICCEQMDIRRALGDLFSMQLSVLLPQST